MAEINTKALAHLAELARLELSEKESEKMLVDLEKILNYFNELEIVDTAKVTPMTGGTALKNVFREDEERVNSYENRDAIIEAFPDREGRQLKVPPVFGK